VTCRDRDVPDPCPERGEVGVHPLTEPGRSRGVDADSPGVQGSGCGASGQYVRPAGGDQPTDGNGPDDERCHHGHRVVRMSGTPTQSRGQVVLLAAFVLAVALVPMVVAYLQLGYDADLAPRTDRAPETDAERLLDRAVYDAARGIPDSYHWDDRTRAVQTVHDRLDPTVQTLERSRLSDGVAYRLSYNGSRASNWAV